MTGLAYSEDLHLIHINLGVLARQAGDVKGAEKHFKQAIELAENYAPARFDLAHLYLSQGEKR